MPSPDATPSPRKTIRRRNARARRPDHPRPAGGAQRARTRHGARGDRRAGRLRSRPRHRRHRHHRVRQGLRRGRRHQGDGRASPIPEVVLDDFVAGWDGLLAIKKPIIAAVAGFALGGRLRARDDVRHHHRRRHRQVRPARDQARHHSRHRRDAAPGAGHRQGQGDGDDPHRPPDGCGGGGARRPRGARRAGGRPG